ncbi:MAG: Uma2 family endonuclease [Acidimicrobiales bacterium]
MSLTGQRITAEEYFALPPDESFTQLIDGEIVVNQPAMRHQLIAGWLYHRLQLWVEAAPARGLACMPVDVVLDQGNVFAPDAWWVAEVHRPERGARRLVGPPDLAVEVRSPSTWRYDVGAKKANYERSGLPELWLVDPEAEVVLVHRRSTRESPVFDVSLDLGVGDELTSPLLAGFTVAVSQIFDR